MEYNSGIKLTRNDCIGPYFRHAIFSQIEKGDEGYVIQLSVPTTFGRDYTCRSWGQNVCLNLQDKTISSSEKNIKSSPRFGGEVSCCKYLNILPIPKMELKELIKSRINPYWDMQSSLISSTCMRMHFQTKSIIKVSWKGEQQ